MKDFTPITAAVTTTIVLAAANSVPFTSLKELLDYARKNPCKLTYSTSGTGGALHMVGEMFKSSFGVDLLHVPYKGSAPAIAAVVSGEVSLAFNGTSESVALARAGKLKILAVAEPRRYVHLPEAHLDKIRELIKGNKTTKQANLIRLLNPVLRGWANYHRHVVAKETFARVDVTICSMLWRWAARRRSTKGAQWVKEKYFKPRGTRNWVFAATENQEDGT